MRTSLPFLALLFGCTQDPIDALESYADEICECENAECIEQVRDTWEDKNVDIVATADLSDDEKTKGLAAIEKALNCQAELTP